MPLSEAKKKANEKYFKANWKQVKLAMPNGEANDLEEYCISHNMSKAGFIRAAIREKMERDTETDQTGSQG